VIRLADCTSPEARVLARDPRAVVLLPLGAIEQHGPHLPLSVDWLGAEEIARRIAPRLRRGGYRPILAPAIPYGVSTLAIGWSGTVSLSPSTLRRLVVDIIEALSAHGFRRFVLTNYQADPDHLRVVAKVVNDLQRGYRVQVLVAGFTPDAPAENAMSNRRVPGTWFCGNRAGVIGVLVRAGGPFGTRGNSRSSTEVGFGQFSINPTTLVT
jgi:hypothetical protein